MSTDLDVFRKETRAWLEANCPEDMRDGETGVEAACWGGRRWQFTSPGQKLWLERMGAKGWTVPTWPKEYGGGGLSKAEAEILAEEMTAIGARKPHASPNAWIDSFAIGKFVT